MNLKNTKIKLKLILIILTFSQFSCTAQNTWRDSSIKKYGFEIDSLNIIGQDNLLADFFKQLQALKNKQNNVVNIIHIGDSHLQTDMATAVIRTQFQTFFGNAGRGLIVPLRVAKTNEPHSYKTNSLQIWQSKRCVFPYMPLKIGIGGLTIKTIDSNASFNINAFNTDKLNYSFNKVKVFYEKNNTSFFLDFIDSQNNIYTRLRTDLDQKRTNYNLVYLEKETQNITIKTAKSLAEQNHFTLFGLSLENSKPGILYHTIGINGAQYKHYSQADYFSEQTKYLQPKLIIISLGTNEAHDTRFDSTAFYQQIDELIIKLKYHNPNAVFLLTTPANSYYRKGYNPRLPIITNTILTYCSQNQLAFWDLQTATGGEKSANLWRKNRLLGSDGVHYTKSGYELQGNLFIEALEKSYQKYVAANP